jgi:coenzyme PQQ precursor peptide PqqA
MAAGTLKEMTMAWTTPEICEVCVGMEVTAYASAEI